MNRATEPPVPFCKINEPILEPSLVNDWEGSRIFNPGVIWDEADSCFRMLYGASPKTTRSTFIGKLRKLLPRSLFFVIRRLYLPFRDSGSAQGTVLAPAPTHLGLVELDENGQAREETRRQAIELSGQLLRDCPSGFGDPRVSGPFDDGSYYIVCDGKNLLEKRREFVDVPETETLQGIAHISLFKTHDFQNIDYLGKLGPEIYDKNAALLPEKVCWEGENRFMLLHRKHPDIQYVLIDEPEELARDALARKAFWGIELEAQNLSRQTLLRPKKEWGQNYIGTTSPPIKTESGWLLFYHAADRYYGGDYRGYLALLDLTEPWRVIARAPEAILDRSWLDKPEGGERSIVFPSGAVRKGEEIFLFYGDQDRRIKLVTFEVEELLEYVLRFPLEASQ